MARNDGASASRPGCEASPSAADGVFAESHPSRDHRGDRPSRHGAALGALLADMAEAGRAVAPEFPDPCLTCAFRKGTTPNQSAGTVLTAFKCVIDIDTDDFACHHGMRDDWPTKLCAGYAAARMAPFNLFKARWLELADEIGGPPADDDIREAYDAWLDGLNPQGQMNVYQIARAWALRDTDRSGEADETPAAAQPEGREPGPKASPETPIHPSPTGEP